ncbi:MAG: ABC transporter ATP-binding protein [Chloroflexi bacterium RBG_13_68_17]|nr:MAG: ABC transporter ATP-binding protein [Chloroflexi bacterium RBG_13_68_17]
MIELLDLYKEYAEPGRIRAVLRGVSARIDDGEFVAIRGRSGSGKTTLLNLIAGIDLPTRGEVRLDGVAVSRMTAHQRTLMRRSQVGFIFQFFNLIPTLTVIENVLLPADLAGDSRPDALVRAVQLLGRVGLEDRQREFPDRLSGGEQQRVAIARALVQGPTLILADEPTGNLDEETGDRVIDLLEELARQAGKTLILVTHSHRIAARADRVLAMEHGLLVPAPRPRGLKAQARPAQP